jgi:hypothetical protein
MIIGHSSLTIRCSFFAVTKASSDCDARCTKARRDGFHWGHRARTRFYMPVLQGVFMRQPETGPAAKAEIGKLAGTRAARLGAPQVSG